MTHLKCPNCGDGFYIPPFSHLWPKGYHSDAKPWEYAQARKPPPHSPMDLVNATHGAKREAEANKNDAPIEIIEHDLTSKESSSVIDKEDAQFKFEGLIETLRDLSIGGKEINLNSDDFCFTLAILKDLAKVAYGD